MVRNGSPKWPVQPPNGSPPVSFSPTGSPPAKNVPLEGVFTFGPTDAPRGLESASYLLEEQEEEGEEEEEEDDECMQGLKNAVNGIVFWSQCEKSVDNMDDAVSAFSAFRRAIEHSSAPGRDVTLVASLQRLQHRQTVMRFLAQLFERKRLYRKQILGIAAVLSRSPAWQDEVQLLGSEELPILLRRALEDEAGGKGMKRHATCPDLSKARSSSLGPAAHRDKSESGGGGGTTDEPNFAPEPSRFADDGPSSRRPSRNTGSSAGGGYGSPLATDRNTGTLQLANDGRLRVVSRDKTPRSVSPIQRWEQLGRDEPRAVTAELLEGGLAQMQTLDFSALQKDAAVPAFEQFGRAVTRTVQGSCKDSLALLENLEPKAEICKFLDEFKSNHPMYRSRVTSVASRLLELEDSRWPHFVRRFNLQEPPTVAASATQTHSASLLIQATRTQSSFFVPRREELFGFRRSLRSFGRKIRQCGGGGTID
eukprot:TRINITY_DN50665_c0_g1_i1.p1 TRINITY_DN50665_c0_g1~~TRINITY_DN50665_c0_g1_i1.p1  ORF type:complete len:480 (-),score=111.52 TRINITY_DN50665_c0_g1_i1:7-1446(-)